jgi:hypothetical protein
VLVFVSLRMCSIQAVDVSGRTKKKTSLAAMQMHYC